MTQPYDIVVIGLTLASSWGNGHATTYRALLRGLSLEGVRVLFLEQDVPWYAAHRDLSSPDFCDWQLYRDVDDLVACFGTAIASAGAVIIGSYVPNGGGVIDHVLGLRERGTSFYDIDTPVTLAKLERGEEDYLRRDQISCLDTYFSFSGGEVLARLERDFGARRAEPLHCAVDETRYHPIGVEKRWDLGYLGTYSPDRQPKLETLLIEPARRLPHRRFAVAGPQYPGEIIWPANVERIEHLPPTGHPEFYSAQRYTLNVTRADMIAAGWSPSVRLFEAAACGTPIISDNWRGLGDYFPPGRAILTAAGTEDVVDILEGKLQIDPASIAGEARRLTLNLHTGRARARELIETLFGADARASTRFFNKTILKITEPPYAENT